MTNAHRARVLGDHGESAPERWRWGGPATTPVHIRAAGLCRNEQGLRDFLDELRERTARGGIALLAIRCDTIFLRDPATNCIKEHFGFLRRHSHSRLCRASASPAKPIARRTPWPRANSCSAIQNEYALYTELPTVPVARDPNSLPPRSAALGGVPGLGINGSYLVFRQIEQHVQRFWRFLAKASGAQVRSGRCDSTGREDGGPLAERRASGACTRCRSARTRA